jgi:hypothetical protein
LKHPKKDGWIELEDVRGAILDGDLDLKALWQAVGQGDTAQSAIEIFKGGWDLDEAQVEDVLNVDIVAVPDDILGEFYRIWVHLKKKVKSGAR